MCYTPAYICIVIGSKVTNTVTTGYHQQDFSKNFHMASNR